MRVADVNNIELQRWSAYYPVYGLQRDRAGPKVAENQDLSCGTTCGDTRLRELEWLSADHWQKLAQSMFEEHVIC